MYNQLKLATLQLDKIILDPKNPRLVSLKKGSTEYEIVEYFFRHEDLLGFIKRIVADGKNSAAERPYVYKSGKKFVVAEGNTRIAAYKVITGMVVPAKEWLTQLPMISDEFKKELLLVDVSISPSRELLAPIKARLHFGRGDKAVWSWLSSRKEIYEEYNRLKSISAVAGVFDRSQAEITEFLLEYDLYLESLKLKWNASETAVLTEPRLEFNPPVRFLQTQGHKEKVGVSYDKNTIKIVFADSEAKKKLKHIVQKLVINKTKGIGATATYDEVFADYVAPGPSKQALPNASSSGSSATVKGPPHSRASVPTAPPPPMQPSSRPAVLKAGRLFDCKPSTAHPLLEQLFAEAAELDCRKYPGAGAMLLRCIIEATFKKLISANNLDPAGSVNTINNAVSLLISEQKSPLTKEEKRH
jgi:hypothetical protein